MLALAHVMDFFANELSGLGAGTLALTPVAMSPLERFFLWHAAPPLPGGCEPCASDYVFLAAAFFSAYETARPAPASDWMPYGGIG